MSAALDRIRATVLWTEQNMANRDSVVLRLDDVRDLLAMHDRMRAIADVADPLAALQVLFAGAQADPAQLSALPEP